MHQNKPTVQKQAFIEEISTHDNDEVHTEEINTEEELVARTLEEFEKQIDLFKEKIISKLSNEASWTKSVQAFSNNMKRVLFHNNSKLEGVLFNFSKEKPLRNINGRKKTENRKGNTSTA